MLETEERTRKVKSIAHVERDGSVRILFDDDVRELCDALGGKTASRRASHVELDDDMRWWVDLSPVGGPPQIGPFETRDLAIEAEKQELIRMGLPWPEERKGMAEQCESSS